MKLIIKNDRIDANRIHFKHNKNGIKLLYEIKNIYLIGIPLKIQYDKIIIKESIIFINIAKKHLDILHNIDSFLASKINNYVSFIHNNHFLKIKKHNDFISDKGNELSFTINCIKVYKGNNYVQIFTI